MAKSEISKWMPLEIDKFFASPRVGAMRDFQRWWYMALLMRAWQFDPPCHLPADYEQLRILAGAPPEKAWREYGKLVTDCFSAVGDSGLVACQPQLEVYHRQLAQSDARRNKALHAAEKRWGNAQAMLKHNQAMLSDANREVEVEREKPNPPYPPKGGRKRGIAAREPGHNKSQQKCDFCGGVWPCKQNNCQSQISEIRNRVMKSAAATVDGDTEQSEFLE